MGVIKRFCSKQYTVLQLSCWQRSTKRNIKMHFILSAVVFLCAIEAVSTQGPRCDHCQEVAEEVGHKQGRTPLINVEQLRNMCSKMHPSNMAIFCKSVVSKWEQVLIEDRKEKHENSVIENVFNLFNWYYVPKAWVHFKNLCQLLDFCYV